MLREDAFIMKTVRGYLSLLVVVCLFSLCGACAKKIKTEAPVAPEAEEVAKPTEAKPAEEQPAPAPEGEIKEGELEKTLTRSEQPGIEGAVLESSALKDVNFDFDRSELTDTAREILNANAELLKKSPEAKIQVEGHCDERGSTSYNLALGERRAASVKDYLVSLGISADKISTISYGEERPLDPGQNEEAWAKNRRAHIVILP
ncbi:MAG: peptidoglycan-associated lipoprotein Pal [bacterium]